MRALIDALGTADAGLRNVAYALVGLLAFGIARFRGGSTPMSGAPAKASA